MGMAKLAVPELHLNGEAAYLRHSPVLHKANPGTPQRRALAGKARVIQGFHTEQAGVFSVVIFRNEIKRLVKDEVHENKCHNILYQK